MSTVTEATTIRCPNCGTRNRVPIAAAGKPRCGKCHMPLPWVVDIKEDALSGRGGGGRLARAGGCLGPLVRAVSNAQPRAREAGGGEGRSPEAGKDQRGRITEHHESLSASRRFRPCSSWCTARSEPIRPALCLWCNYVAGWPRYLTKEQA